MKIPFLSKPEVEITNIMITMSKKTHSLPGLKVHRKFTYKLKFSNTESKPMRVLSISLLEPFRLISVNQNLPMDIPAGQKTSFELRSEILVDYAYNGPMKINIDALVLS